MMRIKWGILKIGTIAMLVCAGRASAVEEQKPPSISGEWAADWSAQKLDAIMTLYAPDAVFHPGPSAPWSGTAAIRANFVDVLAKFRANVHLQSNRSEASGALAFDSGTYEETVTALSNKTKPLHVKGDYVFLFRRNAESGWKILEQTWTEYGTAKL